jgi:hypothetical protein
LKNRRVADARIQPLYVKLMPLGCIVRRSLQLDADSRIELHEALQLLRDQRPFRSESGAGEGQDGLATVSGLGAPERR